MNDMTKANKIICKVGTASALVACFCWGWISAHFKTEN